MIEEDFVGLFQEFLEEERDRKKTACMMGTALAQMAEKDREDVLNAFDTTVQSSAIAAVLKRRGFVVSESSVRRHRRGACGCETEIPENSLELKPADPKTQNVVTNILRATQVQAAGPSHE